MTNYITLREQVLLQLQLQGEEPNGHPTHSHPDPVIRSFFRAAHQKFNSDKNIFLDNFIKTIHQVRPDMNDVHLVNLWFRATQHLFLQRSHPEYQQYGDSDWSFYFSNQLDKDLPQIIDLIKNNNTATHVPQRYRSLAAALRLINQNNHDLNLRVGDIGCSLGLGLKASLTHLYLKNPEFIDDTPNKLIQNLFDHNLTNVTHAVGIDIKIPTVEWVKSCNYPTRYQVDGSVIDQAIKDLADTQYSVNIIESDILHPETISKLHTNGQPLNVIYSSITLYELSAKDKKIALKHIADSLSENGVFIEFTFIDPKNWFMGVSTNVYQKKSGNLSSPLNWLVWNDTRCSRVGPGKDYAKTNEILAKIKT